MWGPCFSAYFSCEPEYCWGVKGLALIFPGGLGRPLYLCGLTQIPEQLLGLVESSIFCAGEETDLSVRL